MKVQIKQLEANPFRNTAAYPIDKQKVATLIRSIEATTFWDNILARPKPGVPGKYEIAYGHHRLHALHEIHGKTSAQQIDIPVRELDDATMLKIMANENAQDWAFNNAVIIETVRMVRDFILKHPDERTKLRVPGDTRNKDGYARQADVVVAFLGGVFAIRTIRDALDALTAIEQKTVDAKAIAAIPEPTKAREFILAVRQSEEPIPAAVQREIAQAIVEEDTRRADIKTKVEEQGYKPKKKPKAAPDVSEFMRADLGLLRKMTKHILALAEVKEDLRGAEWLVFRNECQKLLAAANALLEVRTLVVKTGGR